MQLPRMIRLHQSFESPRVASIADEVASQLTSLDLGQTVQPGQTVAISAGSRGIANIAEIIKAACDHIKTLDAHPVIIRAHIHIVASPHVDVGAAVPARCSPHHCAPAQCTPRSGSFRYYIMNRASHDVG